MRIVLMGQAVFGAKILDVLVGRGEQIVAVYGPKERPGGRRDPIGESALAAGIPFLQPERFTEDKVYREYLDFRPDLTILAFVTSIIPKRFFDAATHGAICYHPSLLPRHRGASAINWAIIMGDSKTGLTIFWPDAGIDTGPILMQREVDIAPDDTTGSLYFNQLFPMGIDALTTSVDLIKAGDAPKIPQDESVATYEPPCDDSIASIDWQKPGREVYNLIRGCDPQPGAYAMWKGEKIRVFGAKLIGEKSKENPGTILTIGDEGIRVALSDDTLLTERLKSFKGKKVSGSQLASEVGLKQGDQFETE